MKAKIEVNGDVNSHFLLQQCICILVVVEIENFANVVDFLST